MKNRNFLGLKTQHTSTFLLKSHEILSNSENGDVSEVSEPLGVEVLLSCENCRELRCHISEFHVRL